MFGITTLRGWTPQAGPVTCWHASPAAKAKAAEAPVSPVPPSYQQTQHLRRYSDHAARGLDMSRLMIFTWEIPGRCDIRAMNYAINAHIRRHDTYHSWFEYRDARHIVRHTIADPGDIEFVPIKHGQLTPKELRDHISTPQPLQWDCFFFGVVQSGNHFTFYASIAHLCVDPMIVGVLFTEIHMMYAALVGGAAPVELPEAGRYGDYCVRQREELAALTVDSPEVRAWIEFAADNGGTLPYFPLPLGDLTVPYAGRLVTETLLDERQTERFERACVGADARFSGGVFGCAGLTQRELTGADTFSVVTTTDTRRTPTELMTTGWFTGLVPVTVGVDAGLFDAAARSAQTSFDSGIELATVPFDRVLELAPPEAGLDRPRPGNFVMSFLDASIAPLSSVANSDLNFRIYDEGRVSHQVSLWVIRLQHETKVTVLFPDNPVARESVGRYIQAMKSAYVRVADGRQSQAFAHSRAPLTALT
ncbi:condensation domain-containing protein [Mycobacterium nebraskense]|uniref:Acyltransferase n=1 Tax=Mycobacterium nebraskense TaxID=244292 RepID=A0A1X1ZH65_9MYCO|nr:condensation domain-containing protein [Mycobacterium nebraskense]KLO41843.1 acyltransferase [Mycobacterium nebraskense]MBI2694758.1 acyltransferase [Mycobacterium nebraskense]ORW22656.1 acyltransferase [Mycobacterium nebraskense]